MSRQVTRALGPYLDTNMYGNELQVVCVREILRQIYLIIYGNQAGLIVI